MNLKEELQKALDLLEEAKYFMLVRESVFCFPEFYNLGKESVHMTCMYGHEIKDLQEATYFHDTGVCPICESIRESR